MQAQTLKLTREQLKQQVIEQLQCASAVIKSNPDISPKALLGYGKYGVVWLVGWEGQEVAMKVPNKQKDPDAEKFREEVRIMQQLDSMYVLKCLKVYDDGVNVPQTILEYCSNKHLGAWITGFSQCSTIEQVQLAMQIATGVSYIHEKGFLHLDLKPPNILFDDFGNPKIADLGFAVEKSKIHNLSEIERSRGTPLWKSPERLVRPYVLSEYGDVWSISVMFIQIVNGELKPFDGCKTQLELYSAIVMQPLPVIKTPNTEFKEIIEAGLLIAYSGSSPKRSTAAAMAKSLSNLFAGSHNYNEQKMRTNTPEIPGSHRLNQ